MELKAIRDEIYAQWDAFHRGDSDVTLEAMLETCERYRAAVKELNKVRRSQGKRAMQVYSARMTLRYLTSARRM